jgi:hypothetical protein
MNLSEQYQWATQAMEHMEQYTSEGTPVESQISYAIAYQTLANFRRLLSTCLHLAAQCSEEYELFLQSDYPMKDPVDTTEEQD